MSSDLDQTNSDFVVTVDGRRGLRVAEVLQDFALVGGDAGGGEGTAVFCLCDEGADYRDAGGVGGDGVVEEQVKKILV